MRLPVLPFAVLSVILGGPVVARAQEPAPPSAPAPPVDSIVVKGNERLTAQQVVSAANLAPHQVLNYRDVQRAVTALFKTGQFDDVSVEQKSEGGKLYLIFTVKERPLLEGWSVRGFERIPEGTVRDRVKLVNGKPLDRDALERSRAAIDSLYKKQGYYAAVVKDTTLTQPSGTVRVVFDISEGRRVAVSEVAIDGNHAFPDKAVVKPHGDPAGRASSGSSGGSTTRSGSKRTAATGLPRWYADHGFIDFQVLGDTLLPDSASGKALLRLTVDEGQVYKVGAFDIQGNRRFSTEELKAYFPFEGHPPFNRSEWESATEKVSNLYANNGYIYARVEPIETRRTADDGTPVPRPDLGHP